MRPAGRRTRTVPRLRRPAEIALDSAVAAQTGGAPIDIAADGNLVAVLESNGGGVSHLTQYRVDEDGNLAHIVSTPIASPANGVAIVFPQ